MNKKKTFLSLTFLSSILLASCSMASANKSSKEQRTESIVSSVEESSGLESTFTSTIPSSASQTSTSNPTSSSSRPSSTSSSSQQSSSSSQSSIPDNSGFSNITEFNAPVEIHTSAQKAYLSYTGNYDQMPENQYPDGTSHQSDSLPVSVSWNYTVPSGKTVSNYSFISGQKADI